VETDLALVDDRFLFVAVGIRSILDREDMPGLSWW
jgi:hypothetical protein